MKCWKSALNAQGSRLIILALQVAAVMEALTKNERQGELQFTTMLIFYFIFESPQVKILFFIFLYIHIVLTEPCKIIYIYIYIYTLFYQTV